MFISKRIIKRILLGLVLLVGVALVVNGVVAWQAQRRFDKRIEELRAAGEPTTLAELAPQPIQADKNAAACLEQIAPQLRKFNEAENDFWESPVGKTYADDSDAGKLPTAEQLAALKALVDGSPEILPALAKAAACDQYASLLDYNLPASEFIRQTLAKQQLKSVASYVQFEMLVLAADGHADEAVRLGIQVLRLARLSNEPLLVGLLINRQVRGMTIEALNDGPLRRGEVSQQVRAELDAELALQEDRQPLVRALQSERAFSIPYAGEQMGWIPAFLRWPLTNWMLSEMQAEDRACEAAKLPLDQLRFRWDSVRKQDEPPAALASATQGNLIGTGLSAVFFSEFRILTLVRALRILNALGEYRDRTGSDAERLDQLSLPAEAMTDPYSGQPLLFKKTDQGWVVYSVWTNGVDDGGRLDGQGGDLGLGPPGYRKK